MPLQGTARIIITGQDATGPAFASARAGIRAISTQLAQMQSVMLDIARIKLLALPFLSALGDVARFGKSLVDSADALQDMSERTGVAVEELAGLQHAFTLNGANADDLETSLRNLSKSLSEAGSGNEKLRTLFRNLGMEEAARGAVDAATAMRQLAEVFPRLSAADRIRVAMELLGKAGERMVPALSQGRAAFEGLIAEGQRLNPITGEMAKQANAFNDTLQKLSTTLKVSFMPAVSAALPVLQRFATEIMAAREAGLGFMESLGLGLRDPTKNPQQQIRAISNEIEGLQKLLREDKDFQNPTLAATTQNKIASLQRQAEYFRILARNQAMQLAEGLGPDREARGIGRGSAAPIKLPKEGKATRIVSEDPAAAGRQLIQSLQERIAKTRELSEVEQLLLFFETERGAKVLPLQREQALALAASIDAEKEFAAAVKASDEETLRLNKANIEALEERRRKIEQLIGQTDIGRELQAAQTSAFIDQMEMLGEVSAQTAQAMREAVNGFSELAPAIEDSRSAMDELGATFSSAFEDAILGAKSFKDILKGLEQDILRIVTRELVTEPLAKSIKNVIDKGVGDLLGSAGNWLTELFSFHGGGMVGQGGLPVRLPAFVLAGAPRLHGGAWLGADEVPAILQTGEEVLSRGDPRNRANGGGSMPVVNIEIRTQDVDSFRRSQGQVASQIGLAINRAMARHA